MIPESCVVFFACLQNNRQKHPVGGSLEILQFYSRIAGWISKCIKI